MQADIFDGFDVPDNFGDVVDGSLFEEQRARVPVVTWHGRNSERLQDKGGHFAIKADDIDGLGTPGPYWQRSSMRYGSDPSAPLEDVWVTRHLRAVLLGVRKRQIITADDREYYFPHYTRKDQRYYVQRDDAGNVVSRKLIDGKFTAHYQAMLHIPGLSDPVVLALRGYTKTVCWSNDPDGSYGNDQFPKGVEQVLGEYVAAASKQKNTRFQAYCTWWIDLVPAWKTAEQLMWIKVHDSGVYMNPFICTLQTSKTGGNVDPETGASVNADGKSDYPRTRFAGVEQFINFQDLRKERVLEWELEWSDSDKLAAESASAGAGAADDAGDELQARGTENDEIPF